MTDAAQTAVRTTAKRKAIVRKRRYPPDPAQLPDGYRTFCTVVRSSTGQLEIIFPTSRRTTIDFEQRWYGLLETRSIVEREEQRMLSREWRQSRRKLSIVTSR